MRVLGACVLAALLSLSAPADAAEVPAYQEEIDWRVQAANDDVVAWRRDIHEHPELGNRETRTAAIVAEHLQTLGFDEVRTGVAHTGVVGILRGGKPGSVVALRADMDALPVVEQVDVPFASKVRSTYNGREVGVMHACGHDVHTAVLMGTASVLAGMREELPGTVVFIFQPAEEGPPAGEDGGARMMIAEGVLDDPAPEAIFGLHTSPTPVGTLGYRAGGVMAGSDGLTILVKGQQTHGAIPWAGVDPIVIAAQIVMGLQTIASRQTDPNAPIVVSIGSIHGGVRGNIIPDQVEMVGTIRVLEPSTRDDVHARIERTAKAIAESGGAEAVVEIKRYAPVTYNDPTLTRWIVPTLQRVAPVAAVEGSAVMASEDFAYFQEQIPGVYFNLGVAPPDADPRSVNHSPFFFVDESSLPIGVRAMSTVTMDYLHK